MVEEWRDIRGYEGLYQVSNLGNVRSLNYNRTGKPRELKTKIHYKTGALEVKLSKNDIRKDYMVARLVAEAFIPNPLFKEKVIHISTNRLDNSVNNLAWAYESEKNHHMYNLGKRKNTKPTYTKISYNGKNYNKYEEIAKDLGINRHTFFKRLYILNWNLWEALEIPIGRRENE